MSVNASGHLLNDDDAHCLLPWSHAIWKEPDYLLTPFDAILRAQSLRFSIFQDDFDCVLGYFRTPSDLSRDFNGMISCVSLPPNMNDSPSCISQGPRAVKCRNRHVHFHDHIDLHFGSDAELLMYSVSVPADLSSHWPDKPWQLHFQPDFQFAEVDPLSIRAVSISGYSDPCAFATSDIQCRLTDEHDSIPDRLASTGAAQQPQNEEDAARPTPPPHFVTNIFGLPQIMVLPPDFIFQHGLLLRTWYIHHTHYPRWTVPRFVEVDHRWDRWQREIALSWRDMILPHEDVQFFTVLPDPDRSFIPRQVHADVIVSQGIDADRYAGLLTVFQQDEQGHHRSFAKAISLPDEVGGIILADAADIIPLCDTGICKFFHGWQQIAYSNIPSHYMHDGHVFVAHITPRLRSQAAVSSDASARGHSVASEQAAAPAPAPAASGNEPPSVNVDDDADGFTTDTSMPDAPAQFEQWQGVFVYRLGRPVVHCFVRWGTYNSILHDIARFMHEHLRNLVGLHHTRAVLVGQHEAEESVVLQYTNDVQLGSTEQLIILDTEVHFQALPAGMFRAPEASRRVHRVVPYMTRQHVLRLARLANYCLLQGDRCFVYFNGVLWPEQDNRARSIDHGCYLRVVATPPLDSTVPTEVALNFAISIDEEEGVPQVECTARPRQHRALSLMQVHGEPRMHHQTDLEHFDLQVSSLHLPSVPSHDAWIQQLSNRFSQFGLVECLDEGPIAYVTTWYINHQTWATCEESRPVRLLGSDITAWYDQLIDTWRDLIDPSEPVQVHIVSPTPPATETESTLAHVVLEQRSVPLALSAGVLTVIRRGTAHASMYHIAVSIARITTRQHIFHRVHLSDLCHQQNCKIFFGRMLVQNGFLEDLDCGFNLVIDVAPSTAAPFNQVRLWAPGIAAAMDAHAAFSESENEHVAFFQSAPRSDSDHLPFAFTSPVECKQSDHIEDRSPRMTIPSRHRPLRQRPLHDGAEDWIAQLGNLFRTHGTLDIWEDLVLMQVTTWYIHHGTHQTCNRPRDVQLTGLPVTWIDDLRRTWATVMDHRIPFSIHVVRPRPPQFREHRSACHIVLVQGHQGNRAAAILTALLEGYTGDGIIQGAFSVSPQMDLRGVIEVMELHPFCANRRCTLIQAGVPVPDGQFVEIPTGTSLRVRIEAPEPVPSDHDPIEHLHFEDLSLLQRPPPDASFPSSDNGGSKLHVNFAEVYHSLAQLDTHFTVPAFDIEPILAGHADWLPQCLPWIRSEWYASDGPVEHIQIYYDGSFHAKTGTAGSAAIAFVQQSGHWKFAGASSACLHTPEFGSYTAELRAALIATKFAYDLAKITVDVFGVLPLITFVFDPPSVGRQAEGIWQGKKDKVICHAIRSILRIMQSRWALACEHQFVSGHSGDPGNELADTIAHCAAQGFPLQDWTTFLTMYAKKHFVQALSWGWAVFKSDLGSGWVDDRLLFPTKPSTMPMNQASPAAAFDPPTSIPQKAHIRMKLLTCNVLTLHHTTISAREIGAGGPARMQTILQQIEDAGVTIFALQETRLRTPLRLQHSSYHLWHSAANERGHFGMLVGCTKNSPFAYQADSQPHHNGWFDDDAFSVVVAEPRLVILRISTAFCHVILIAAHAPHSGADSSDIDQFWQKVTSSIPGKYDDWPRLLLADANCRFGDFPNAFIGNHDAEISTPKSEAFCDFVAMHQLFLPATFATCHSGPSGTWCHPKGTWTRNDVIGVSGSWPLLKCESWIDLNIDVSLAKEDHRPACVMLEWMSIERDREARRRLPKCPAQFCPDALLDLRLSQTVSCHLDVHSHYHLLQDALAKCTRFDSKHLGKKPQKTTMSAATWDLVCAKRKWRTNLAECQQLQTRTFLQTFFAVWRDADKLDCIAPDLPPHQPSWIGEYDRILSQLDLDVAVALHHFRSLGSQVTRALRFDDASFYDQLAQESGQWLSPQHARQLWGTLRRSLPKFRSRRLGFDPIKLEKLDDQWMPHFCQLETGAPVEPAQLLADCHRRQMEAPIAQEAFDANDLPSILHLEDVLRQTSANKATGYDILPSVLFRSHAAELADIYYPLLLKMFLWQHEPIDGKGGHLAVIHKKGSPYAAHNYRGIMLLPTFTKRVHAILRTHIMDLLVRQRPSGQLGGFAKQQVTYGSQSLQVFGRIMDGQGLSSGVLFLDLTTAFHRLIREWTSGIAVDDDLTQVLASLDAEGLPIHEMCARLHLPCLLERLKAPPFLIQLIKDVHSSTWMTVGRAQTLAQTRRGTRPGSPLADCIFHVLMSDILHQLQTWILEQADFQSILQELDIEGSFVAWADDLAIPWATRKANEMPTALRRVLTFAFQLFRRYGFLLNLERGKTSAVVAFRGSGAPLMRQRFQLTPCPGDTVQIDDMTVFLHYVPVYKHLGTIFAANHRLDAEISSRIGQAQAAFSQIARPILCNRHLPERTRVQLFQTLIGTKLFFGLGSWITPTQRQITKLRAALVRMLQRVLRLSKDDIMSTPTHAILQRTHQPDPRVRLAVDRLLYAQRLWAHGPADLQHLLHREQALCETSWIEGLQADLAWLHSLEQDASPGIDVMDLTSLFDYWQQDSAEWDRRVKRGYRRYQHQEHMMHTLHRMHSQFFKVMRGSATFLHDPQDVSDDSVFAHECFCGRCFSTPQGLAAHKRQAHQIGAIEKHLIDGPTCPSCLKFFWSRQRLYQHLAYVPRRTKINQCFQDLQRRGFRVLDDLQPVPNYQIGGLHRSEALQALGPHLQPTNSRTNELLLAKQKLIKLEAEVFDISLPPEADSQQQIFWDQLTQITKQWFLAFTESGFDSNSIVHLPDAWLDVAATADPAYGPWLESVYISWGEQCLADLLATLLDGEAETLIDQAFADFIYDFPRMQTLTEISFLRQKISRLDTEQHILFPHRQPKFGSTNVRERNASALKIPTLFGSQEPWLARLRRTKFDVFTECSTVPGTVETITQVPAFLVVHLFSGRRRATDIHAQLEELAHAKGFRVHVLSLDTAVSIHFGNLQHDQQPWRFLLHLYQAKRIAATIVGSPCETFSAARHHQPEQQHEATTGRWPRPLRSSARFFGLNFLTTRELRQVAQGSEFFLQGIIVAALTLRHGGIFLSEHPWKPEDAEKVSIWTSPWVQLLLQLPNVALHRVCQWRWGARSSKPTGILAINCPSFARSVYKRQLPNAIKPDHVAIGRDRCTGEFRTAILKEYPAAFSAALAGAVADGIETTIRQRRVEVVPLADPVTEAWVRAALAACKDIRTDAPWLPDFQG